MIGIDGKKRMLSLAMIVKNDAAEARLLARCLDSVRGVIDEVGAGQNILYGILDETLPSSPANPLNGFTLDEVHGPQTPLIGVLREVVL